MFTKEKNKEVRVHGERAKTRRSEREGKGPKMYQRAPQRVVFVASFLGEVRLCNGGLKKKDKRTFKNAYH